MECKDSLEAFRNAAWGKNSFLKWSTRTLGSGTRTIEYLEFDKHLWAVRFLCHALDEKVVVLEEYRTAMRKFREEDVSYEKGACILGQSGIGKTCFIAYALVERLREKQPVAVQIRWSSYRAQYILFTSKTVTIHDDGDTDPLEDHGPVWAFVDSTTDNSTPMMAFQNTPNVRIFQTTPPAGHNWRDWTEQNRVCLYIMDVPSIEEVEDLALILGKDVKGVKALADKWGPVPRTVLQSFRGHDISLENEVTCAIRDIIYKPEFVFGAIAKHDSSTTWDSSSVFFIQPQSKIHRTLHSVYVPTRWLVSRVADELVHKREDARAKFFQVMSAYRFISGLVYEDIVRCFLARGETFTIRWYDQEIGTGGPVLAIPPGTFGIKFLESAFGADAGAVSLG